MTDVELCDWLQQLFETVKRSVAADVESALGVTNGARPSRDILDILMGADRAWALDHTMGTCYTRTQII